MAWPLVTTLACSHGNIAVATASPSVSAPAIAPEALDAFAYSRLLSEAIVEKSSASLFPK